MENRLKKLRSENNMTLSELSKEVKIPLSSLSRYENGSTEIKIGAAQQLADFFNVSISYIMGLSDERNEMNDLIKNKISNMFQSNHQASETDDPQVTIFLEMLIQEITKFISILVSNNDVDFQIQSIIGLSDFIKLMSAMNEEFEYKKVDELRKHLSFLKDLYTGSLFHDYDENNSYSLQKVDVTSERYLSAKEFSNHIFDKVYLEHFNKYYD
jgi:transcriptional regulator with XRE-family HTH domain